MRRLITAETRASVRRNISGLIYKMKEDHLTYEECFAVVQEESLGHFKDPDDASEATQEILDELGIIQD